MTDLLKRLLNLIDALMRKIYPLEQPTPAPSNHIPDDTVRPTEPPTAPIANITATSPTEPPVAPQRVSLETFCLALRDFEGKPGDLNYRNNNPGNFRCSPVGYLPKYGDVKCKNGFAVFPTYALGWEYLLVSVKYRAHKHPEWTILDFFSNYAPTSDGNSPIHYANNVAKRCGVSVNTKLGELFA